MRNRYKKNKYYPAIAKSIGRNYHKLRSQCFRGKYGCFESRDYEDIFQDTVLYVIQDPVSLECRTEDELIAHFLRRYRMIEYQTVQDSKLNKTTPYADYKQAKKETTEE